MIMRPRPKLFWVPRFAYSGAARVEPSEPRTMFSAAAVPASWPWRVSASVPSGAKEPPMKKVNAIRAACSVGNDALLLPAQKIVKPMANCATKMTKTTHFNCTLRASQAMA